MTTSPLVILDFPQAIDYLLDPGPISGREFESRALHRAAA
jgi:hypothetical protein